MGAGAAHKQALEALAQGGRGGFWWGSTRGRGYHLACPAPCTGRQVVGVQDEGTGHGGCLPRVGVGGGHGHRGHDDACGAGHGRGAHDAHGAGIGSDSDCRTWGRTCNGALLRFTRSHHSAP